MRLTCCLIAILLLPCTAVASPSQVVTDDIARFWATYDAVRAEPDAERRVVLVQQRYIDPGSPGLHALMQVRNYTAREYAEAMQSWPRFWTSVRPLTANAQQASATLDRDLDAFRALYPALRPATITYAMGVLRTGGTTLGDKVLIGAEMALGDERVDVSELPAPMRGRLRIFYDSRPGANNAQNNLHEYVHTQQRETTGSLAQYAKAWPNTWQSASAVAVRHCRCTPMGPRTRHKSARASLPRCTVTAWTTGCTTARAIRSG